MLNILVSAFDCAPGVGSEGGGAWRWVVELAKRHRVTVLTDTLREDMLQPYLGKGEIADVPFVFYRPRFLHAVPLTATSSYFVYGAWQIGAVNVARRLHAENPFDLILHLSYGVFRQTSWLGFVGPPFVFGPVGGGEDAPWRLKRSLPPVEKARELTRSALNLIGRNNPLLHFATSRAALVLARTPETRACLPRHIQARTIIRQEIGCPILPVRHAGRRVEGEPLKLLFAGRLVGWKGIHFAIRAIRHAVDSGADVRLDIVGWGPFGDALERLVKDLRLEDRVAFAESMPQDALFEYMSRHDALLFPSLHDSGGNVVLESLAIGLPVICLDLGGPPCFVDESCGIVVSTVDADEDQLAARLGAAVARVATEAGLWPALQAGALRRAQALRWDAHIDSVFDDICSHLGMPQLALQGE